MESREALAPAAPAAGPSYGSYLHLPELLQAQKPLSDTHDEMLFIIIHQTSELWIKLCLHELNAACKMLRRERVAEALKMLARVGRVQEQLIQSWAVLSTMTPADYGTMRGSLGGSSGFQSHQYRLLEYMLGNKNADMIAVHAGAPDYQVLLYTALRQPSLYDEALAVLARRNIAVPADALERDFSQPYQASSAVETAWSEVYAHADRHWDLYELAEKLIDIDGRFQAWRFGHLKAVERIIGFKRGTGGSAGVPYLATVVPHVYFPELLTVRTSL